MLKHEAHFRAMAPQWLKKARRFNPASGTARSGSWLITWVYNAACSNGGATSMKHFTLLLVAVLMFNSVAVAQATQAQDASHAAKVKAEVQKRGTGEKSRVKVRLRDKAEVKGYISKIEDASFDVTDKNTGRATTIPYADVEKVQGSGLSKGAKIGIIAGVAVVTFVVVIAVALKSAGY